MSGELNKAEINNQAEHKHKIEIQKNEFLLAEMQQMSQIGFWKLDLKTDEVKYSDEFYKIYDLKPGEIGENFADLLDKFHPDDKNFIKDKIDALLNTREKTDFEGRIIGTDSSIYHIYNKAEIIFDNTNNPLYLICICQDITELVISRRKAEGLAESLKFQQDAIKDENNINETLYRIGKSLSAELELEKIVNIVTDECTQVTHAEFGAFFYNKTNNNGESYMLYTISGVPREMFSNFPMPRNTQIFAPTFRGDGIIRLDDVTKDSRYGKNEPYFGMPQGHLPVRSYLAVPVISRSGEVIGGLFFGHSQVGVFSEKDERIVAGIASQASVAIDNAALYKKTREDEAKLRLITEAIPQIVWTANPDGDIDFYNQYWYEYTGTSFEQIKGSNWGIIVHPDDLQETVTIWSDSLNKKEKFELKCRFKRNIDQSYRWHLCRGVPLINENVQVIKWFGTCTDIDEQVHSEENQKFFAEAATLLITSLDYEKTLENIAKVAVPHFADWAAVDILKEGKIERLAVYHTDPKKIQLAKELEQKYPVDMNAPNGLPNVLRTGKSEYMTEIPDELLVMAAIDEEHLRLARELGLRSYIVVPLKNHNKTIGAISFVTEKKSRFYTEKDLNIADDLAKRASLAIDNATLYSQSQQDKARAEKIKEELKISNIELEKSNRELEQFAYVASHDLQEPLRTISNFAMLLERRHKSLLNEDALEFLEMIVGGAKRMKSLIEDLLEYSKVGKKNSKKVDLNETVKSIISNLKVLIEESKAIITYSGLPIINAEPTQMLQLFQNIITNSIKYKGDKQPFINISFEESADKWQFSITDNGIGINKLYFDKIFVIFQRLHEKGKYEGTGIGLATCKKIVDLHGGKIWLESEEGKGSTFYFTISKFLN